MTDRLAQECRVDESADGAEWAAGRGLRASAASRDVTAARAARPSYWLRRLLLLPAPVLQQSRRERDGDPVLARRARRPPVTSLCSSPRCHAARSAARTWPPPPRPTPSASRSANGGASYSPASSRSWLASWSSCYGGSSPSSVVARRPSSRPTTPSRRSRRRRARASRSSRARSWRKPKTGRENSFPVRLPRAGSWWAHNLYYPTTVKSR